jgi:hypothetical protein
VFRIGKNTFWDQKNKIPMKIPEFKRSEIRLIAEFREIPNGFPNQAINGNVKVCEAPTHAWSIDDIGMLDTSGPISTCDIDALEQEIREVNSITAPEEVLQFHGYAPPKKAEGTICLVYENMSGLSNRLCGNEKVDRMKELHDELEVNMTAYCEHKLNMPHKKNVNGFNQLYKGGEAVIQSTMAHNVQENVGRTQQGGTSVTLFGYLTEQLDNNESEKDPTG